MPLYDISWCRANNWGDAKIDLSSYGLQGDWRPYTIQKCNESVEEWCHENNYGARFAEDIRLKCSQYGHPRKVQKPEGQETMNIDMRMLPYLEVTSCAFPTNDPSQRTECNKQLQRTYERTWTNLAIICSVQVDSYALGPTPMTSLSLVCQGQAIREQIDQHQNPPESLICEPREPEELVCK